MQLVMLNFLAMFHLVFIFFLFLIGVACAMNYLPHSRRQDEDCAESVDNDVIPPPPLFAGEDDDDSETAMMSRDTYVVMQPPLDDDKKVRCPIHVV